MRTESHKYLPLPSCCDSASLLLRGEQLREVEQEYMLEEKAGEVSRSMKLVSGETLLRIYSAWKGKKPKGMLKSSSWLSHCRVLLGATSAY